MPTDLIIVLEKARHRDKTVVTFGFDYDQKVIEQVKQVAGARWGQTMGCWYVPEGQLDLHAFFESLKGMAFIDYSGLKQERKKPPKKEKVIKGERLSLSIGRPREANPLPSVLSKPEIQQIITKCSNIKHKCILSLIYSAGLRRSELIHLRPTDIDSQRGLIRIEGAKGKKDRYSLLSAPLLLQLRAYFKRYKPQTWLFEGPGAGHAVQPDKHCENFT